MTQIVLLWTKGFESSAHMVIHQVWAARINSCLSPARQVTWQLWKIAIAPQQCKWWIQVKEWRLAGVPSASKGWGQCQSQGFLQDRQGAHATSASLRWWTRWRGTDGRYVTSCKAASNCFLLMPIIMCLCLHQTTWATVLQQRDTRACVHSWQMSDKYFLLPQKGTTYFQIAYFNQTRFFVGDGNMICKLHSYS